MTDTVHIDSRVSDRIQANLPRNLDRILMMIGFDVEGLYKQLSRVATSAMRNSTYTVGRTKSGLTAARAAAKAARKGVKIYPHPKPEIDHVHVGPSVEYAIYNEEGTERMTGDHALRRAGNEVAEQWNNGTRWKELVK